MDSSKSVDCQHTVTNGKILSLTDISLQDVCCFVKCMKQKCFTLPNLPEPYLAISYGNEFPKFSVNENRILVTADSEIVKARIILAKRLTKDDASVKKTLELTLKFKERRIEYKPGDVFGFLCFNPVEEVSYLLKRLEKLDVADVSCRVLLEKPGLKKKIPAHLPQISTLRHILSTHVDLRSVPKKVLLRILSTYASDDDDRVALEFLSSREGASAFEECILIPSIGILDILDAFPSCHPPIERLLEYLPLLRPRFYSVTSSPLIAEDVIRIAFNVINIKTNTSRTSERKGICTGWLDSITSNIQKQSETQSAQEIELEFSHLCLRDNSAASNTTLDVDIYRRFNKNFFLPEDTSLPIIMIGPGTGIAPFIGFMQHREQQMLTAHHEHVFGEMWLFYGCRHKEKDFLYRDELERLQSSQVLTHFLACFSRDQADVQTPRYVQDNIILHSKGLIQALDRGGVIYVCGDAKGMSKDVQNAFIEVFKLEKGLSKEEAESYLFELGKKKRYLVDLWK